MNLLEHFVGGKLISGSSDRKSKVFNPATGEQESFAINGYKKNNLLNGFDDIDYLENIKGDIETFAKTRPF